MESYKNLFLELLNKDTSNIEIKDYLLINLYIMLISLNNNYYNETLEEENNKTVKIFLTKINNLKVKIQLKRKQTEIDNLINDIKKTYELEENILFEYIDDKTKFFDIISSKDAKKISSYIDKLTKKEIYNMDNIEELSNNRNLIIEYVKKYKYNILDNKIIFEKVNYSIDNYKFYEIFNYLLNIDNYYNLYKGISSNTYRREIIKSIIKVIKNKSFNDVDHNKILIPIILNYILLDRSFNNNLKTDSFIVENIKISDLYKFANEKNNIGASTKWKNFNIPNEYLFKKIKEIIDNGMYYYNNDLFIMELVINKNSDFKVSINIASIKEILTDYLTNN